MKSILIGAALACALFFPGSALAEVSLAEGKIHYQDAEIKASLELDEGALIKVANSDYVFAFVSEPLALKAAGLAKPSLLFFGNDGRLIASYAGSEGFDPEMCAAASLSPGKKIIALDNGTWLLRIWTFFNFPDFTAAADTEEPYLPYFSSNEYQDLAWVDDNTVVVTDVSEAPVSRPCPADPCEPLDVVVHRIKEWESASIAKGTELCNYQFITLAKRTATVMKTCTKNIDDWGTDESSKRTVTREKVQIPAR